MPEIVKGPVKGPVKGWKCFDENLQCRSFPFEVGKTYEHAGEIRLCSSGFHFHEHGENLFEYYANSLKTRVCEVIGHDVLADGDKSVCRKIEIIRELSVIEVCRLRFGNSDGYGYGYGNGNGDGYGYGYGYGNGDGYGYGYGYGNGDGYGDGYGYGYGYGNGDGNGYGYGYGYGYGKYGPIPDFIIFEGKAT